MRPWSMLGQGHAFYTSIDENKRTLQERHIDYIGACGGCMPSCDGNYTYMSMEGHTVDIRYDFQMNATACIPDVVVTFAPWIQANILLW